MDATKEKLDPQAECKKLQARIQDVLGEGEIVRIDYKDGLYAMFLRTETVTAGKTIEDVFAASFSKLFKANSEIHVARHRPTKEESHDAA